MTRSPKAELVCDTNVFVAAGFSPGSNSGHLIRALERGILRLVWDVPTRRETERILRKIPPLPTAPVLALFEAGREWPHATDPDAFAAIEDPEDRKFAALATAAGVELVSQDDHLLSVADRWPGRLAVLTPHDFLRRHGIR